MDGSSNSEIAARLKELKDKQAPQKPAEPAPVVQTNTENTAQPTAETPTEQAVPVVDEKAVESTTSQTTPEPTEEEFTWDSGIEEPTSLTSDLGKLGSALNLQFSNEEEATSILREKLTKLQTLETETAKTFENVPSELKEAIDLAKKGGDWKSLVGNSFIDPTKLNPVELFEDEYIKQNAHRFRTADNKVDEEALDKALNSIDEGFKIMEGNRLKQRITDVQNSRKQEILNASIKQQENFVKDLGSATRELPNLISAEKYGIKVESKHVAAIHEGILSGKLVKKHLGDIDSSTLSKLDAKKLSETLAKVEFLEGISKAQYNRGEVKAKKEILSRTQNVQIENNGRPAQPDFEGERKPITNAEKMKAFVQGTMTKNSL